MRQGRLLPKRTLALAIAGLVIAASSLSVPAAAQVYYYQCPPGYGYLDGYDCVPLSYFYGPPTYVYPNFGFGFFYGPGFRRGFRGHDGHGGHPFRPGGHPGGHSGHPGGHSGHH